MAIINGTSGDDFIFGTDDDDTINGGDGNDYLRSLSGDDTLNGEEGNDTLIGDQGNDTLKGGNGDDFLRGNQGDDYLDGGSGFDRVSYVVSGTTGVTVNLNIQGVAQDTGGAGIDTLVGIEHVSGTIYNDILIGNEGDNWLWGGSDTSGVTGNDTIFGNGGNDLVEVGTGNHTLDGGTGNDTLSLFGNSTDISSAGVTVSLALQGSAQNTEQGMMLLTGFENLSGSVYDDVLTGNDGNNVLAGDQGNDTLSGGGGNDTLYGDGRIRIDFQGSSSGPITTFADYTPLNPTYVGGNDTLIGGKGDDCLYGGQGNDVLTGSQGIDTFIMEASSGNDQITDFNHSDTILFDGSSGVTDYSQLVFTMVGSDTLVSWGTSNSILVDGMKPKQLSAQDFQFGASADADSISNFALEHHGMSHANGHSPDYWF
ncbi:MAG: calcium-binding protein [Sphingomicrobium sp.]